MTTTPPAVPVAELPPLQPSPPSTRQWPTLPIPLAAGIRLVAIRHTDDHAPVVLAEWGAAPHVKIDLGIEYDGVADIEWHSGQVSEQIGYEPRLNRQALRYFVFSPIHGRGLFIADEPGLPEWAEVHDYPSTDVMLREVWLATRASRCGSWSTTDCSHGRRQGDCPFHSPEPDDQP